MDYTSTLGRLMHGSSRGASIHEVEKLREEIESMVRENAAQINYSEEGGTSTAETSAPSPGVARRVYFVTRPGTPANPSNEESVTSTEDTSAPSPAVARRVNAVTRSGTRGHPSNEDTEGTALVCTVALNDPQLRRVNPPAFTTERRTDLAYEGEHISSFESFDHATGSPDCKGLSEEDKGIKIIPIPTFKMP